jgi:hypothetical protein
MGIEVAPESEAVSRNTAISEMTAVIQLFIYLFSSPQESCRTLAVGNCGVKVQIMKTYRKTVAYY